MESSSDKKIVNPCSNILCNNRMPVVRIAEEQVMIKCSFCDKQAGPFFKNIQYSVDGVTAVTSVWNARNEIKQNRFIVLNIEDELNENFSAFEKILVNVRMIVVSLDTQEWWKADDFFKLNEVRGFTVEINK